MHFKCPQCGHEFCSGCYMPFYQRGVSLTSILLLKTSPYKLLSLFPVSEVKLKKKKNRKKTHTQKREGWRKLEEMFRRMQFMKNSGMAAPVMYQKAVLSMKKIRWWGKKASRRGRNICFEIKSLFVFTQHDFVTVSCDRHAPTVRRAARTLVYMRTILVTVSST